MRIQPPPPPRSYVSVARGVPPEPKQPNLAPAKSGPSAPPPPIVNPDAQRLAKRPKMLVTTGMAIFSNFHQCLKAYSHKEWLKPRENEAVAFNFKETYPELFDYILQNGPEVRNSVAEHAKKRSRYLAGKVLEALYWLPMAAVEGPKLHPETVLSLLRKHILLDLMPEEIALKFENEKSFLFKLIEIPYSTLAERSREFSKGDIENVRFLLPLALRHVYLHALKETELMNLMWTYEKDTDLERTKLLQLSHPSEWSPIVKARCATWHDVAQALRKIPPPPLKKDPLTLQERVQLYRNLMCHLTELEKALLYMKRDHLLFFTQNAFCDDQVSPMFPNCLKLLPILFNQLDLCQNEFRIKEFIDGIGSWLNECEKRLASFHSKPKDTNLSRFYFNEDKVIYKTGLRFLFDFVNISKGIAVKNAIDSALKQLNLQEKDLPNLTPENTEQFLYCFCCEFFGLDPNEWMQSIIGSLPDDSFTDLETRMKQKSLDVKADNFPDLEKLKQKILEEKVELLFQHLLPVFQKQIYTQSGVAV